MALMPDYFHTWNQFIAPPLSHLQPIKSVPWLHFGFNNKKADYILGNQRLSAVEEEKDLGVIVGKSLKSSRQCAKATAAANAVLGMIRRTFLC